MRLIKPSEWKPEGIDELEAAAFRVVRSLENKLVVAGPGAGKTELLAQRASFLLKTGTCPFPRRILAISFKRDAARNLKERVQLRCGHELARRFDSFTFDAFSKSLLDRFRNALPEKLRPSDNYAIDFDIERNLADWLNQIASNGHGLTTQQASQVRRDYMYRTAFLGKPINEMPQNPTGLEQVAANALWQELLAFVNPSQLNFQMIGRLAALVLDENPTLLSALRSTYAFLFLDEFQDATQIQFDLTITAFADAGTVVTAVGDDKQRIMVWAGALQTVFEDYMEAFGAKKESLLLNHRSAPELVRIQNYFVKLLDPEAPEPVAAKIHLEGECRIMVYENHHAEAESLAGLIAGWIENDGLKPRDICLLTRNRPDQYTAFIINALGERGVKARVESELQDLLTEPVVILVLSLFKIALTERAREAWQSAIEIFFLANSIDPESAVTAKIEHRLAAFLKSVAPEIAVLQSDTVAIRAMVVRLLDFVGQAKLRLCYPQYQQGAWYDEVIDNCVEHLSRFREQEDNWLSAVNDFGGEDCIPIMTVHKSKGLEYHSVIFVGLEDSALWSFQRSPEEEKRAFFVAFSRAISRVIFTFCYVRERGNNGAQPQTKDSIGLFYDILKEAGVEEERFGSNEA